MNTVAKFQSTLQQGKTSTDEALKLFDELDTVNLEFMIDRWQGSGFHTNHPLDGLLEAFNWYGKEFVDPDCVHPLLFLDGNNQVFKVIPNATVMNLALRWTIPQHKAMKILFNFISSMLKTEKSQARIRMMEHRNQVSATMIYDCLPIHDVFRKVDDNTVLGIMDFKGMEQPFFFILNRDN